MTESVEELRKMLAGIGADFHHREKAETLRARYDELTLAVQPSDRNKKVETRLEETVAHYSSKDNIIEGIKPYMQRGLVAEFNQDGWNFKYKNKEDSGTYAQPLQVIVRCADMLSRG